VYLQSDPASGIDLVVTSASDLSVASQCEYGFARRVDVLLGRADELDEEPDEMLVRASELGDVHEARVLQRYRDVHGDGVVEIDRPAHGDAAAMEDALRRTRDAFAAGAPVVFQAAFFVDDPDDAFVGYADFIVRRPDGRYRVQDTKLARHAKVVALLQLAAYVDRLEALGVPVDDTVELLLGDGTVSTHRVDDIRPVYRKRWARMRALVDAGRARTAPVGWGAPDLFACGQCEACTAAIAEHRDVLQVAGLRITQRDRLAAAGITTIDELAASDGPVDGVGVAALDRLRIQARLQLRADGAGPPPIEIVDANALTTLPVPDPGDVFFDFEGDPLHDEGDGRWGLDYLFGLVDVDEAFTSWRADSFAEERRALRGFLDFVAERRARHPGMRIYHYASYERTHLSSIAARHGEGEDEVDRLLREHVLVDLYPLVRKVMRVGSPSYSIKKLEPLYMGDELRTAEVTTAAASITEYAAARDLIATGRVDEGEAKLAEIVDYNRYDCVSTLRLRDWLVGHAERLGVAVGSDADARIDDPRDAEEPSPLRDDLLALAGRDDADASPDLGVAATGAPGSTTDGPPVASDGPRAATDAADRTAAALAAAAIDYHRRERKTFWWGHFSRLAQPIDEWADVRDVLVVDGDRSRVERDWYREGRQRKDRRVVRLHGTLAPGSRVNAGTAMFALYDQPAPFVDAGIDPGSRVACPVTVLERGDDGSLAVEEAQPPGATEGYRTLPVALAPGMPPRAAPQPAAIAEWAQTIVDARPGWPEDPVTDILRRRPPRTRSGTLAPVADDDHVGAVVASLLDLDGSYVAVQGPPGTGKTYLGAHVIARLVRDHRWRIGVVAQSHNVVENLLKAVVGDAGLDVDLVGKEPKGGASPDGTAFTVLRKGGQAAFAHERERIGFALGGTAWTFANDERVPRGSLDLLVIDEAGQFSLASTAAAAVGARNLLLLGDPQQLPQVSQGSHPAPVDRSALGWIAEGHDVLPADLGYFLARSRRMRAEVAAPVSRLSYEGRLASHPDAPVRTLEGIDPGLHPVPVEHRGNAQESPEEAATVVRIVREVIDRRWTEGDESRPLGAGDLIVITPYNAQRQAVHDALTAAGLGDVRVGTVDGFQGQEAAVAIVTLAASSPADVPRGLGFLIMRNRLNVAISRAKWAAYLVHSPALTEHLPTTPHGVAELSAFIALVEPGRSTVAGWGGGGG